MSRKVRVGPVYLSEVKFADTARGDHLNNQRMLTEKLYTMYVSAETLPGFFVCISKQRNDLGSVYVLPISCIASAKVAEHSLTKHQPLGTAEPYDTPNGTKKKGSMPPRSDKGRPIGSSKKSAASDS